MAPRHRATEDNGRLAGARFVDVEALRFLGLAAIKPLARALDLIIRVTARKPKRPLDGVDYYRALTMWRAEGV